MIARRQFRSLVCSLFIALSVVTVVSGCGFKPRGQADLPFSTIYIDTGGFSLLGAELQQVIKSGSSVEIMDAPDQAEVILKIVSEQRERHIISLTGTGSVREFQLLYRVAYRVTDNDSIDLTPQSEVVLRRDMLFDDTLRLAKESEAEILYTDMQRDAVLQILRRLSVVLVEA